MTVSDSHPLTSADFVLWRPARPTASTRFLTMFAPDARDDPGPDGRAGGKPSAAIASARLSTLRAEAPAEFRKWTKVGWKDSPVPPFLIRGKQNEGALVESSAILPECRRKGRGPTAPERACYAVPGSSPGRSSNRRRATSRAAQPRRQLGDDEQRHVCGRDAGEAVGQAAGDGDRRIGEAGRGGEPISRDDVERDARRDPGRADAAPCRGWSGSGRTSRSPRRSTGRGPVRAFTESCSVGRSNIRCAAQAPRMPKPSWTSDIGGGVAPGQLAARGGDQAHRRVHMRAGDRPEHGDQHEQDRAGRDRVAEQGDRVVPARQMLGHDPGADHGGEQEEGADALGRQPPRQRRVGQRTARSAAGRASAAPAWPGAQQAVSAALSDRAAAPGFRHRPSPRRW